MPMNDNAAVFAGALLEFACPVAKHAVIWLVVFTIKVSICIAFAAIFNKAIFRYTTPVIRRDFWSYAPYATGVCFIFMLTNHHFVSLRVGPYALPHFPQAVSMPAPAFGQRYQYGASMPDSPVAGERGLSTHALASGQASAATQSISQTSDQQAPDAVGIASLALIGVWICGALFCGLRIAAGLRRLKTIQRDARSVDAESPAGKVIDSVLQTMAKNVKYLVLFSDAVTVPLMWGYRTATILLPVEAADWPEERLICAIRHEAVHASGLDWPAQYNASLSCAALWFNPLVWFAKRMHRAESERVADSFVLLAIPPANYAAHLLDIARALRQGRRFGPPAQAVAMARSSNLAARVETILSPSGAYVLLTPAQKKLRRAVFYIFICAVYLVTYPHIVVRGATVPPNSYPPASSSISAETEPFPIGSVTVAAPGAATVTLPNGATVTLVGVRDTQKRMGHSWLDDNDPVTRRWGGLASAGNLPFHHLPPGAVVRTFVVMTRWKLSDQPAHAWNGSPNYPYYVSNPRLPAGMFAPVSGYSWQITPHPYFASLKAYAATPETSDSGTVTGFIEPSQEFRADDRTCTLRYAVAAGHWKDITWLNNQAGTESFSMSEGKITTILIPDAHKVNSHAWANGHALIKVTDPFSRYSPREALVFPELCRYQRVLVALDRNHSHAIYSVICSTTTDNQGNVTQTGTIPDSVLKRTDSFLFAARPYEWAEFRNVALQPR